MARVIHKTTCKCGAVTLYFDNGAVNSMCASTYKKLPKRYHVCDGTKREDKELSYCCNRCVNHYGIDINPKIYGENNLQTLEEIQYTFANVGGCNLPLGRIYINPKIFGEDGA